MRARGEAGTARGRPRPGGFGGSPATAAGAAGVSAAVGSGTAGDAVGVAGGLPTTAGAAAGERGAVSAAHAAAASAVDRARRGSGPGARGVIAARGVGAEREVASGARRGGAVVGTAAAAAASKEETGGGGGGGGGGRRGADGCAGGAASTGPPCARPEGPALDAAARRSVAALISAASSPRTSRRKDARAASALAVASAAAAPLPPPRPGPPAAATLARPRRSSKLSPAARCAKYHSMARDSDRRTVPLARQSAHEWGKGTPTTLHRRRRGRSRLDDLIERQSLRIQSNGVSVSWSFAAAGVMAPRTSIVVPGAPDAGCVVAAPRCRRAPRGRPPISARVPGPSEEPESYGPPPPPYPPSNAVPPLVAAAEAARAAAASAEAAAVDQAIAALRAAEEAGRALTPEEAAIVRWATTPTAPPPPPTTAGPNPPPPPSPPSSPLSRRAGWRPMPRNVAALFHPLPTPDPATGVPVDLDRDRVLWSGFAPGPGGEPAAERLLRATGLSSGDAEWPPAAAGGDGGPAHAGAAPWHPGWPAPPEERAAEALARHRQLAAAQERGDAAAAARLLGFAGARPMTPGEERAFAAGVGAGAPGDRLRPATLADVVALAGGAVDPADTVEAPGEAARWADAALDRRLAAYEAAGAADRGPPPRGGGEGAGGSDALPPAPGRPEGDPRRPINYLRGAGWQGGTGGGGGEIGRAHV